MRFRFREDGKADMDELLRSRRPAPPQRLVDDLVARVEGTQPTRARGRSRLRYTLAVAVSVALLVPVASFGGLSSISSGVLHAASVTVHEIVKATKKPGKPKKKKKGKAGVGRVFASIGTYADGSWICHWRGGTYDATTAAQGANWLPVQLTSPGIYTTHQFETFDIGPSPSLTTQGACVAAATGGNVLTTTATATTTSPTNAATIVFSVSFSQSVSDFAVGDITVGGTAGGTLVAAIFSGSGAGPYVINVTGQTSSGTVTINIGSGTVHRASGVANFASGTPSVTYDNVTPTLTTLQMFDTNGNGKVDQVKATFNEILASYTAGNTPWTLGGVPSSGTLLSVSVSGAVATLTITEGGGAADTAVGSFLITLATSATGIRDAAGNQSSFVATAPADKASPVLLSFTDTNGANNGKFEAGDTFTVTFSEAVTGVASSSDVQLSRSGNTPDTVSMSNFLAGGAQSLGQNGYITKNKTANFNGSALSQPATNQVRVTLAACSGNCTDVLTAPTAGSFTFTAVVSIQDAAGNASIGSVAQSIQLF